MIWVPLIAIAVLLAWRVLRPRRPRLPVHQFEIDWDYRVVEGRPGWTPIVLRAWCAHPTCRFDVVVYEWEEDKARRAYARFHRGGDR